MFAEREPLYREVADAHRARRRAIASARSSRRCCGERRPDATVRVPLGDRSYDVLVGHGAPHELAVAAARDRASGRGRHAGRHPARRRPGPPVRDVRDRRRRGAQDARHHRASCAVASPGMGLTRNDVVIGVGGGMVTDVAGFAAAVLAPRHAGRARHHHAARHGRRRHRRQDRRQPAAEGKNLVGAFWQPSGVVCDLDALATLPPREVRCGLRRDGEVPLPHRRRPAGDGPDRTHRPLRRDQGRGRGAPTSARAAGGRCSTTATRSPTRWRSPPTTSSPTARPWRSGWSTPPTSPDELGRIDDARVEQHYEVVGGAYEPRHRRAVRARRRPAGRR